MNSHEFKTWFAYHTGSFTWLLDRLAKMPAEPRHDADATSKTTYTAWRLALQGVPLAIAKEATDALFRGAEPEPKGFDDHPRAILRYWNTHQPKRADDPTRIAYRTRIIDGEPTHRCPHCRDEGSVLVYHPQTVQAMRNGEVKHPELNPEGKVSLYVSSAICGCEASRRFAKRDEWVYFNELVHLPVDRWTRTPTARFQELQQLVAAEEHVPGCKDFA